MVTSGDGMWLRYCRHTAATELRCQPKGELEVFGDRHVPCPPCSSNNEPLPTEVGVGVMALLFKTQFVAVVGGGPYPLGKRNVVKIVVADGMREERSVSLPNAVEAVYLDHQLIIILTTVELRLHNFETGQCMFSVPMQKGNIGTGVTSTSVLTENGNVLASVGCRRSGSESSPASAAKMAEGWDTTASSTTTSGAGGSFSSSVPFAIDFHRKVLVFRSSQHGFSLVRYDTEFALGAWGGAEVLGSLPAAHEHSLSSLALLLHEQGALSTEAYQNSLHGSGKKCLVASSSARGTLIRVWRYVERAECLGLADSNAHQGECAILSSSSSSGGKRLSGHFVKVKEVRNTTLPTSIFHMQFLGETFLFCVARNIFKVFFIGEREEPKPHDVSTKDPAKSMRTKNNQSSFYHLGLVSTYFRSEWAACECPLPLKDTVFLPKWVSATPGLLRQLMRDGSGTYRESNMDSQARGKSCSHLEACSRSIGAISGGDTGSPQEEPGGVTNASAPSKWPWGNVIYNYISRQMVPLVETVDFATKRYRGSAALDSDTGIESEIEVGSARVGSAPTISNVLRGEDVSGERARRNYAAITELAQSFVVWWERPAYWQLDYMTNCLCSTGTSMLSDEADALMYFRNGSCESVLLHCVTCDGTALGIEFDPMAGSIECGAAVAMDSSKC
uniref:WGS project CAEQ00000000 data, annotated contig 1960 n=1 Tax=Trypanosoma congolense (strain IL3000) TaxID=1068625 RepID=F9WAD9_TRYCI|nr:unnamed protein product [Trypanosoma congolense IL3000]